MTIYATMREARRLRRNMLRFFRERGLVDFAERTAELRNDPRFDGAQKAERFRRILDDYAAHVTKGAPAPGSEAAHQQAPGDGGMAVLAASEQPGEGSGAVSSGSIRTMEASIVGDD